jgi:hypothetical protein
MSRVSAPPREILETIESLTPDEDERQELWILYLEGATLDSPAEAFRSILEEQELIQKLISELHTIPTQKTLDFIASFSQLEQSFMFLLLLGFTKEQISQYKMVQPVHLNQALRTIASSPSWGEVL